MSKHYWEKSNSNNCHPKPIVNNSCADGAIIVGRQLDDGLDEAERLKLYGIETNAQVNIIEGIEVNSEQQIPNENKVINIFVPTKVSQLENDKNFVDKITPEQIKIAIGNDVAYSADFSISTEQWATLTWENTESESEIPSENPEIAGEDN